MMYHSRFMWRSALDDISTTADGVDSFKQVKDLGRYKECKRTDGISTTALIGRLLSLERAHHRSFPQLVQAVLAPEPAPQLTGPFYWTIHSGNVIDIAPDQQVISYREGSGPTPQQRVVYLAGSFDLLHEGHLDLLEASKADNDFLIVGVHDDLTVNSYMGQSFPIMSAIERALGVLMLRIVDQVVVTGLSITAEFLEHFKVRFEQGNFRRAPSLSVRLDILDSPRGSGGELAGMHCRSICCCQMQRDLPSARSSDHLYDRRHCHKTDGRKRLVREAQPKEGSERCHCQCAIMQRLAS
eukprot:m.718116 g.718116  ORF g.718116 m.718116 type:complete len:298 (-) comp58809_c1_seq15:1632-2525(-)